MGKYEVVEWDTNKKNNDWRIYKTYFCVPRKRIWYWQEERFLWEIVVVNKEKFPIIEAVGQKYSEIWTSTLKMRETQWVNI